MSGLLVVSYAPKVERVTRKMHLSVCHPDDDPYSLDEWWATVSCGGKTVKLGGYISKHATSEELDQRVQERVNQYYGLNDAG